MRDSGEHTHGESDLDELLAASRPRVVTTSAGVDAELHRLVLAHASHRREGRVGRVLLAVTVLIGVALGGAAVGAATAATSPSNSGLPPLPHERTVVMSKALDGGSCDLVWTLTVRTHVDGYLQKLDDAAAYLGALDTTGINPDAEWLEALNEPDALALVPQRTPLERQGNAFMMAVAKSAWTNGNVSDDVIGMETMTVCAESVEK